MVDTIEIFRTSFTQASSITIDCSCGITHVDDDELNLLEENELKEFKQFETKKPDKVIHHDYSPCWFFFGKKQVVVECPCKSDIKIHNMLLNNEYNIVKFFKEVNKQEKKNIKFKENQLEGL